MLRDMTYCANKGCPFKDCRRHPSRVPFGFVASFAWFDQTCRRYISWLVNKQKRPAPQRINGRKPVVRVEVATGAVERFPSVTLAAASIGIGTGQISQALVNNRPRHGYQFYYESEYEDGAK